MGTIEYVDASKEKSFSVNFGFPFSIAEARITKNDSTLIPQWPPIRDQRFAQMPLCKNYHSHTHFEMIYVLEGIFTEHLENSMYILNPGEATLLNSNIRHYEGSETECHFLFINFSPEFLTTLFTKNDLQPGQPQLNNQIIMNFCINENEKTSRAALDFRKKLSSSYNTNDSIRLLFTEIQTALHDEKAGYSFFVENLLLKIFEQLENKDCYYITHIEAKADTSFILFTEINQYIQEKNGRLSLKELSDLLHYNADYIGRIIHKETGLSFSAYCQSVWVEQAKKLLTSTGMNINEIVYSLGYESSNIFYRVFQEATGMTPAEFRKSTSHKE